MSVILTAALQDRLGGSAGGAARRHGRGPAAAQVARPDGRARSAHTYWWAVALIIPALLVALLLPRAKPEPVEEEEGGAGEPRRCT